MPGIKAQCNHCGHTWIYTGSRDVTSCPYCGWRVRIHPARRISTPGSDALISRRKIDDLI